MRKKNFFLKFIKHKERKKTPMDIIKIIGVGLISLIIIIIVKQYKPEFTLYISLLAGAIILIFLINQLIL